MHEGGEKIGKDGDLQHRPIGIANRLQNGSALAEDNAGGYTENCAQGNFFGKVNGGMSRWTSPCLLEINSAMRSPWMSMRKSSYQHAFVTWQRDKRSQQASNRRGGQVTQFRSDGCRHVLNISAFLQQQLDGATQRPEQSRLLQ